MAAQYPTYPTCDELSFQLPEEAASKFEKCSTAEQSESFWSGRRSEWIACNLFFSTLSVSYLYYQAFYDSKNSLTARENHDNGLVKANPGPRPVLRA